MTPRSIVRAARAACASGLMLVLPVARAHGQTSCSATVDAACAININLLRVPTLSQLTTSTTTLSLNPSSGRITASDVTQGFADAVTALTVTVQTNAAVNSLTNPTSPSSVQVSWVASQTLWTGTGCPFAVSDLRFATSPSGPFSAVPTTTPAVLLPGITRTTGLPGRQVTLYFRTLLSWSDAPSASCTLPMVFTVAP